MEEKRQLDLLMTFRLVTILIRKLLKIFNNRK